MTFTRIQFTLVSLLLASAPLAAQEFPLASEVRRTAAAPAAVAPTIDGGVLGDPAWMGVPAASGFVQTAPDEGQPASEKTEAPQPGIIGLRDEHARAVVLAPCPRTRTCCSRTL